MAWPPSTGRPHLPGASKEVAHLEKQEKAPNHQPNVTCRWKLLPEVFLGILYAKRCITYSCILGAPNTLGNFLFAEKHRLGEFA